MSHQKKLCIYGIGGFGREVLCCYMDSRNLKVHNLNDHVCFMVDDEYFTGYQILGVDVIRISDFEPEKFDVVVGIGDPKARKEVVNRLPEETTFTNIIHPSAVLSSWVKLGVGCVITAGSVLTCDISIGNHAHINLNTTIGHDCIIGDYFTSAPGVNISGRCTFGNGVYLGTNVAIRERVEICDNVVIGMGGLVIKNISEEGIYVGSPVKKMN